ncbi:MAG TPA: phosphoribosylglycinamide formyltransferase [Tepidisphaeraceae bacterium]|jgi:formyltetrahydrofolate-dependent phosphoribosylglycinamide formyltransferase|nr:phosphoribosylglycinamide formyltransferase [Tepidisphaeraceae bacterium]
MNRDPLKLAVLVSGSGTTLQNLLDEIAAKRLNASVELVIGSKPDLLGVQRGIDAGVPTSVVSRKDFAQVDSFANEVWSQIDAAKVDLVCFAGWLCLLPIPQRYICRVINIHPSLLPAFGGKGMYGQKVHEAVLAHGCKVSGCTVHFVDDQYDNGPIILQRVCEVLDDDTPKTLAARVFEQEREAYPQAIRLFGDGRISFDGRRVRVARG